MNSALDLPTLVLNRHWTPVHVTAVRHALALVCKGQALIVCPGTYAAHNFSEWIERGAERGAPVVRGIGFELEAPEVIVLGRYAKVPPRGVAFNRRNLHRRDEETCQYCGTRIAPERLTIDHVMPVSRGGKTEWENCVLACHRCNGKKADRTPREASMRLLRQPEKPSWSPRYAAYARGGRPTSWEKFIGRAQLEAAGV